MSQSNVIHTSFHLENVLLNVNIIQVTMNSTITHFSLFYSTLVISVKLFNLFSSKCPLMLVLFLDPNHVVQNVSTLVHNIKCHQKL